MDFVLEKKFKDLLNDQTEKFGQEMDLTGILFLIGVQELGKGPSKFNKQQKTELLHVAVCRLLEPYGYYEYEGRDQEGWPHYRRTETLPYLAENQQDHLIKEAILDYFSYGTS
ncbi:MAG: hypothetical protein ABEH43_10715 [Flavobacteriales bacterium]